MAQKRFSNQKVIVTGAGEGIGYQVARQFCQEGAAVLLNDILPERAQTAAENITAETGSQCIAAAADIAEVDKVRGLVRLAVERFGRLDACVCNAGLTSWGSFFDYEPADFQRVVDVNLRGNYFLAQAAARQFRAQGGGGRIVLTSSVVGHQAVNLRGNYFLAQAAARQFRAQGGGGRIVLTSSVVGHQAVPYLSAYGMTKAALEMLAKNLVLELSAHGITINCVAPGAVITPRNLSDDPDYETRWAKLIPIGRAIETEDIANAVLFLASAAAEKITGQALVVDGGWTSTSPIPDMEYGRDHIN